MAAFPFIEDTLIDSLEAEFSFIPDETELRRAIRDPRFDRVRFRETLYRIREWSDMLFYSDDLEKLVIEEEFPHVLVAAAKSRYVLGEVNGYVFHGTTWGLRFMAVVRFLQKPDTWFRQYVKVTNPLPPAILLAAIQPDVDVERLEDELKKKFSATGRKMDDEQLLELLESESVKEVPYPIYPYRDKHDTFSFFIILVVALVIAWMKE